MAKGPEAELTVEGLNPLVRALKKAGETDMLAALKAANQEGSNAVADAARQKVPRGESGQLAETLRSTGTERASYVRAGKKRVPYAGVIHFGWPKRGIAPPQPYLFEAMDSRRSEVEAMFKKRIAELAQTIDASTP